MTSPKIIFSAWLALCEGNSPITGGFASQRPMTHSFAVFLDLRPNKRLSKQSSCRWFETPSCWLWRHCNATWPPYSNALLYDLCLVFWLKFHCNLFPKDKWTIIWINDGLIYWSIHQSLGLDEFSLRRQATDSVSSLINRQESVSLFNGHIPLKLAALLFRGSRLNLRTAGNSKYRFHILDIWREIITIFHMYLFFF